MYRPADFQRVLAAVAALSPGALEVAARRVALLFDGAHSTRDVERLQGEIESSLYDALVKVLATERRCGDDKNSDGK